MPIYEYRCKACGDTFEVLQSLRDEPLRRCEHCSGDLEKLLSRTAFVLKGGGWASDAYGRSKSPSAGENEKKGSDNESTSNPSETPKKAASNCAPGGCGCKS